MKRMLLIVAGLAVGFVAGSWTPLGELGSPANLKTLAMKSERLSALIGQDVVTSRPQAIRSEFLPYLAMVDALHTSSVSLETRQRALRLLRDNLETEPLTQGLKSPPGHNAIFADSPNAELIQVIGAIESENQQIVLYLQTQSPTDEEYHLTRSIYESNNQWLETMRFMVQKNNGSASVDAANAMIPRLEGLRQRVEESTFLGRKIVMASLQELVGVPTTTHEEKILKDKLITFVESYSSSFEVEESLASMVTDYPAMVARSMSGHNISNELAAWDMQTLQLVTERMQLKAYRQELVMNLAGPTS